MTDLELLARIIKCEAGGEGDNGMRAVATVVMNRVRARNGEYGRYNDIPSVIFAPGQFDCAREVIRGKYNPQNIYNIPAEDIHYQIAQWAIDGNKFGPVANSLWYFNPYKPSCATRFPNNSGIINTRIGNHCFYDPTSHYNNT